MDYYGWRPYVSVAERRRKAAARDGEAQEERPSRLAGDHRRPHDRQDLLGQGVVREPRTLQRLCQPVAARADLCAQRFGDRSSDCARRDQGPGQRLGDLRGSDESCAGREGALEIHLQGLRGRDRFAGRASAGAVLQGRHGTDLPAENRACSHRPAEIKLSCSCPDWADMCKHVAAVLYGIGARFDQQPELLFRLRDVDEKELIAGAGKALPQAKRAPAATKVLGGEDLSALFGLDMAEGTGAEMPGAAKKSKRAKSVPGKKAPAAVGRKAKAGTGVRRNQSTTARKRRGSNK